MRASCFGSMKLTPRFTIVGELKAFGVFIVFGLGVTGFRV